jgi:hypothetical protein
MAADSRPTTKQGVHPWFRRLHLALNYLPVLFGGILFLLMAMAAAGLTDGLVGLGISIAWVIVVLETIGRRPFIRREGSQVVVRNIARTRVVDTSVISGAALYKFRLGKDTCPGISTRPRGRPLPVLAYFGCEVEDLARDLHISC